MPSTSYNNHNSSSTVLADLLGCSKCHENFSVDAHRPVNLPCGHAICLSCATDVDDVVCTVDHAKFPSADVRELPLNLAILRLLDAPIDGADELFARRSLRAYAADRQLAVSKDDKAYAAVERGTLRLADYLRAVHPTEGGELLSRALQRKLANVLCAQPATSDGVARMFSALRAVVQRVLTESILALQNSSNISSHLWSAVRSRGCQFLGPTMQEGVLRLILSALSKGELIARKALVMYIVRGLTQTYPQVSKTCVGHVVQLAYRASCFNVIKRDGESSLMQLKAEFRNYPSLRREHDTQIVHIAVEAGLRISPEQWSSLLYGDLRHRAHMQTIVDQISAPRLLANAASELRNLLTGRKSSAGGAAPLTVVDDETTDGLDAKDSSSIESYNSGDNNNETLSHIFDHLKTLEIDNENLKVDVELLRTALDDVQAILDIYVWFMKNRSMSRPSDKRPRKVTDHRPTNFYKARMCRDVSFGRYCIHGDNCTYAHSLGELCNNQNSSNNNNNVNSIGYVGSCGPMAPFMAGYSPLASQTFDLGSPTATVREVPPSDGGGLYVTTADGNTVVVTNQIDAQPLDVQPIAAAVLTAPCQLTAPTVAAAQTGPPSPTTILTNILDGTMTTLTPLMAGETISLPSAPSVVGAIDTTTGELVNLISVHNVINAQMMTAVEPEDALPSNVMMETIPIVPLLVQQPAQPPIGMAQQPPIAAQNVLMPTQPIPIVPVAATGATLFSIPVGAMSPSAATSLMMNAAAVSANSSITGPTVGIMPAGYIIGTPPNFWTNDSFANDSGDESYFAKLSTTTNTKTQRPSIDKNINSANSGNNLIRRQTTDGSSEGKGDEEQLFVRRNEIINQLVDMRPSANILEDFYDDEYEHHVSYTVANSVLFDEKDAYFKNAGSIDLPPLPIGSFKALDKKATAPRLYNTFSTTFGATTKAPPATMSTNYLRTASANPLPFHEPMSLATVQSGCKNVIKDAIEQPLIASSLQNINFAPQMSTLHSMQLLDALPTVIKPLSDRGVADPQEMVALSIDRIIDVKERINDVKNINGAIASAVEKEQLKVELSIANRQITTLDEQTKESCLLKELKAVDKQIENLSVVV